MFLSIEIQHLPMTRSCYLHVNFSADWQGSEAEISFLKCGYVYCLQVRHADILCLNFVCAISLPRTASARLQNGHNGGQCKFEGVAHGFFSFEPNLLPMCCLFSSAVVGAVRGMPDVLRHLVFGLRVSSKSKPLIQDQIYTPLEIGVD